MEKEKLYDEYVKLYGRSTLKNLSSPHTNDELVCLEYVARIDSELKLNEYMSENKIQYHYLDTYNLFDYSRYSNETLINFMKVAPHLFNELRIMCRLNPDELKQAISYCLNQNGIHKYFLKSSLCNCIMIIHKIKAVKLSYLDGYKMYKLLIGNLSPTKYAHYIAKIHISNYVKYNFIMQFLSTYKKINSVNKSPIACFYRSPIFDINLLRVIFKLVLG